MNRVSILKIKKYVKEKMSGESTGHDWYHVERVFKTASKIAQKETAIDFYIVEAAALLHDICDSKIIDATVSEEEALQQSFDTLSIDTGTQQKLREIILNLSFRKNIVSQRKLSREGQIVQDADRLEALGAIGIARAFAYGGKNNRVIYDPKVKPQTYKTTEEYKNANGHTINHFYEKLFTIRKTLHTKTAKQIAMKREKFLFIFLKQFYAEWEGKD